ncbi:xylulokinase [Falsiroseomonas sp. CW058]|uniref:xylulokinase n=1 Tax=Falsiroseomonas sp. CW058 TaxID=3388664 RepID=UPI003D31896C
MTFLGIDLGTSAVKAVLLDAGGAVLAQAQAPLDLSRPRPMWSEQDPAAWWRATGAAVAGLGPARAAVRGIGLSGQMHGAVLLDAADRVLRPAILWNDGRSHAECAALDPAARRIAGNRAMPGFTAPKLAWVRTHEPAVCAATRRVLLPKDWLRLGMTGEAVSEMSDAAGTLWLDVAARAWSAEMLALCGLAPSHMPRLVEGSAVSATLRADVARDWGLPPGIPVAGGAGDNAAGAVGIGCIAPGQGFVSLGTSGVVFVADAAPLPDPDRTVHAFCHALPGRWHRMAVILSAASALGWAARALGAADEAALLAEVEAAGAAAANRVTFLPYLSGERTPHDDPAAAGVWFGMDGATTRADLARAVLEGVAFALADGLDALEARGGRIAAPSVIGGGARSALWGRILATALGRDLAFRAGAEIGPALGAARLAMLACGAAEAEVCTEPPVARLQPPEPALAEGLARRRAVFRALYPALKSRFAESAT